MLWCSMELWSSHLVLIATICSEGFQVPDGKKQQMTRHKQALIYFNMNKCLEKNNSWNKYNKLRLTNDKSLQNPSLRYIWHL